MPNALDAAGLSLNTQAELITYFSDRYRTTYGTDINLDQNSPDGQWMMTMIQAVLDVEDLLRQIFNSMDPDQAIGVVLDMRCAFNGIQRQAGTHTVTNVTVVTDRALNLFGLDQVVEEIYTVQDNAGNKWELIESVSIGGAGSNVLTFQAEFPGAVLTVPNTITVPVTVVLGVVSVNNPTTYTTLGINEETDAEFRLRRQQSVSLSSQGYLAGLLAALLNITGMSAANVYENTTGSTDGDGIPSHSIWVITSGTADSSAIANAIYTKRNAGCGMKGDEEFSVVQPDGSTFIVRWDVVTSEDLFIKFTAASLDGVNPPDIAAIRAGLPSSFVPGVHEQVNINDLATDVQVIDPNTLVTAAGFSSTAGGAYTNTKTPATKAKQFAVSAPKIIILPIIVNPTSAEAEDGDDIQFEALGGYGAYVWTVHTNVSGGSISADGLYTAGPTPGTDVIRATDTLSNFTAVNVVVS